MDWWNMQVSQVERQLQTNREEGLKEGEASKRLTMDGKNRLEQGEGRKGFFWKFLAQFNDFMILLLIGAAVAVWFQFYLQGLRVTVAGGLLIKQTGNIFNRRLVLVLKNISAVHTVSLHPGLPRLIRVFYPDRDFLIVGLTGRQAAVIEKAVKQAVSLS